MQEKLLNDSEITNDVLKEKKQSRFFNLTYKEKLGAFIFFNILGYSLQLGSFTRFYKAVINQEPGHFAFLYSIGNVLSLTGTFIYIGIDKQIQQMTDNKRKLVSLIFFASLIFCLVFPLFFDTKFAKYLTALAILIQMISYWYYTLTFFPKIQNYMKIGILKLKKCFIN